MKRWRPIGGRTFLLPAILLLSVANVRAQETVLTEFSFGNARVFVDVLPDAAKAAVANRVARVMADSGHSRYRFLQWRPSVSSDDPASGHRLVLRMEQKVQPIAGSQECYRIDLIYVQLAVREPLYPMCSFFSPQDTSKLIHDVNEIISRNFREDNFRQKLEDSLIREISLAESIIVNETQGIVVPVSFDVLSPAAESLMGVEFLARDRSAGGQEKEGEMDLTGPLRVAGGSFWVLQQMRMPPEPCNDLPCLLNRWRNLQVNSVKVFMKRYHPKTGPSVIEDISGG